jgi:hypothetical protein
MFRSDNDLSRQIPADVKERTLKAGVEDVDWYAGRLSSTEERGFTDVPRDEHLQLRKDAQLRRSTHRRNVRLMAMASVRGMFGALRPRRTDHVG